MRRLSIDHKKDYYFNAKHLGTLVHDVRKTTEEKLTPEWIAIKNDLHSAHSSNEEQIKRLVQQKAEHTALSEKAECAGWGEERVWEGGEIRFAARE